MGARVVVNYRSDKTSAEETASSLPHASAYQADVGDPAQVESMMKAIGRVDVLVNNAGAVRDKLLIQMSPPDWEDLIKTDLLSAFATTRAAIMSGMMRARWGRIVNISSIVGITGNAGQTNYAAAKAGLIGFTKSVAREYGSRNITCNAVAPGYVRTELTKGSLTDEMVAELVKMTPIKREAPPKRWRRRWRSSAPRRRASSPARSSPWTEVSRSDGNPRTAPEGGLDPGRRPARDSAAHQLPGLRHRARAP